MIIMINQLLAEYFRIREVPVVRQADAKGRREEERLRFKFAGTSCCWVTHMPDAHGSLQTLQRFCMEHVADHSVALLQVKLAVVGDDARGILSPVLEHDEAVIQVLDHIAVAGDSEDSAHGALRGERRNA